MKRKVCFILVFLLLLVPLSYGFDWERLTSADLRSWSDAIDAELNKISDDVPPLERNGYYWYLYGTMKMSASYMSQRFIFHGQHQLEQALMACKGIFSEDEDEANTCIDDIKRLIDGPPLK